MYAAIAYNAQYLVKDAREMGAQEKNEVKKSNFITYKLAFQSLFAAKTLTVG